MHIPLSRRWPFRFPILLAAFTLILMGHPSTGAEPCDQSPFPFCDGDCPAGTICLGSFSTEACECVPVEPCEQTPFPICDGDCPAGTICLGNFSTEACECVPVEPCEQTPFPVCDGSCPTGSSCTDDPTGIGACICESVSVPCEQSPFPFCDGGLCPPDQICIEGGAGSVACECAPCDVVLPGSDFVVTFIDNVTLRWNGGTCASTYNVYRATVDRLVDADMDGLADDYGSCFASGLFIPEVMDRDLPPLARMHTYLVTGVNAVGEGNLGFTSGFLQRPNLSPCP